MMFTHTAEMLLSLDPRDTATAAALCALDAIELENILDLNQRHLAAYTLVSLCDAYPAYALSTAAHTQLLAEIDWARQEIERRGGLPLAACILPESIYTAIPEVTA